MLEKIRTITVVVALMVALVSINMISGTQDTERPITYEIVGICSTTGVNSYDLVVASGAFEDAIAKVGNGSYIPILLDHDMNTKSIIGKVTHLTSSLEGTLFKAHITASKTNKDVIDLIRNGYLVGVSIGFKIVTQVGRTITELDLYEISLVALPADRGAHIISIKELP